MKKYKALICVTLVLALFGVCFAISTLATSGSWADNAESDTWYTNYTDAPTYEISSAARLASLAKLVNAGNSFEGKIIDIKGNIDLGDHYWVPIGNADNPFKGTVIGNLKTVSGMHINALNGTCAGLFGNVQGPGEVANLAVTGSINVTASGNIGGAVGIAGNGAKITAVSTDVSISVSGNGVSCIGGILGRSNGTELKYCSAAGAINAVNASTANVGGVVGSIDADTELGGDKSSQTKSTAAINITAGTANVGGIAGNISSGTEMKNEASDASTEYVWSLGAIAVNASNSANVGGFIGKLDGVADLDSAKFANSISVEGDGNANVGGIVGAQKGEEKSTLSYCYFTTGFSVKNNNNKEILTVEEEDRTITVNSKGTVYTGGIYGSAESLDIVAPNVGVASSDSGKTVSILSVGVVGGVGGSSTSTSTVKDNASISGVIVKGSGNNAVIGGIFGKDGAVGELDITVGEIKIEADGASNTAGGIVGELACEKKLKVSGTIEVTGLASSSDVTLGGIVGGGTGKLKQSDITGEIAVTAKNTAKDIGGIAGSISGGIDTLTVHDAVTVACESTANNIGGIAGAAGVSAASVTIEKAVSVTAESDSVSVGGCIGSTTGGADGITAMDTVTVEAKKNVTDLGGIIGASSGNINNITLKKAVSVTAGGEAANAGGVIGNTTGSLSGITAEDTVTICTEKNTTNLGGIIASVGGSTDNIQLKKAVSVLSDDEAANAGGIIGNAAGAINGITADETVTVELNEKATNLGGIIGKSTGNIEAVTLNEIVSVTEADNAENVGGVIGSVTGGTGNITIKKDISVTVDGELVNAGGIAGSAAGLMNVITAEGDVTVQINGAVTNLGGSLGLAAGGIDTLNIKGKVTVAANDDSENVGGIAGQLGGKLDLCTIGGDVDVAVQKAAVSIGGAVGKITASGIVGSADGKKLTLNGTVNVISADTAANVGGVVGSSDGAVNYVYIDAPVTVTAKKEVTNLGGVIGAVGGDVNTVTLNDAVNVTADAKAGNFGGVIGKAGKNVKSIKVYKDITVIAESSDEYGGVIGLAYSNTGTIDAVTVTGDISVTAEDDVKDVGGIVGNSEKSFSKLDVTGNIMILCKAKSENAAGISGKIVGNLSDAAVSGIISVTCGDTAGNAAGVIGAETGNITNIAVTATESELLNNNSITVVCNDTSSNVSGIAAIVTGNVSGVEVTGKIAATAKKATGNIGGAAGSVTGNISNVTLKDKVIVLANGVADKAGGVAGAVTGNIDTVNTKELEVICDKTATDIGGVCGNVSAEIKTVCVNGKINATGKDDVVNIGGVAGFVGNGMKDIKIYEAVTVKAESAAENIGGVAGIIEAGGIESLEINGKITLKSSANSENLGGVVGKVNGSVRDIAIRHDFSLTAGGAVKNIGSFAGLVSGDLDTISIIGNISVKCENLADNAGGLIGKISGNVGKADVSGISVSGDIGVSLTGGKRPANDLTPVNVGGLFGQVQGNVNNVTVNGNTTLSAKDAAPVTNIGGVAGLMAGNINKLNITGNTGVTMNNTAENSGGIVGSLTGDLAHVTIGGNINVTAKSGVGSIGGLSGVHTGNLSELRYSGTISVRCNSDADYAGGLSGAYNGVMSAIHTSGSVNVRCAGDETYAGGIAGSFEGHANGIESGQNVFNILGELTVTLSGEGSNFSTGVFAGNYTAGAFAGINKGSIENISLGDTVSLVVNSRNATIGGFAGVNNGSIKYSYTTADIKLTVSTAATLGGLVGLNTGMVEHSSRDIDVALDVNGEGLFNSFAGGLIGQNAGTVDKSYTDCDLVLNGNGIIGGGLIGNMTGGLVTNSYAGDKSITGGSITGGLIGSFNDGRAEYCYSAMKVNGTGISGGIFGEYIPDTVDEHILLCRFLSDGINYNMLPAGKGGEGILDQNIKYIRALSGVQLQDGRAESGFFNYYDFDAEQLVSWDFDDVWQFVISDGAKYIFPSLVIDADKVILNYDIRWYTDNPNADTFTLSNEADLSGFAMILNGKFEEYPNIDFEGKKVVVSKNINIQRSNWEPIENFKGIFDGQGKLINGLRVSNTLNAGLFGTILPESTIVNLTIEADKVTGINTAGVIAGINNGTVLNASVIVKDRVAAPDAGSAVGINNGTASETSANIAGTVYGTLNAGGIAGTNNADINKPVVTVKGTVMSDVNAGGIAGESSGSIKEADVTVKGSIIGTIASGGIAGENSGSISDPVATVNADAKVYSDTKAGGIAADNTGTVSAPKVILNGSIEALEAGGIAGSSTTDISNADVSGAGTLFGTAYTGGIVSRAIDISVTDSVVSGIVVSGNSLVGGVAGEIDSWSVDNITIYKVTFKAEDANATLGAIAGRTTSKTANIVFNGAVDAIFAGDAKNVGGIIGETLGDIKKLTFAGNIGVELNGNSENAGGVIGLADGELKDVTVTGNTTVTAKIISDNLGGIVGYAADDVVDAAVAGDTKVIASDNFKNLGGVVGILKGNLEKLHYTGEINVSNLNSGEYSGGIIGRHEGVMSGVHTNGKITVNSRGASDGVGGIVGYFKGAANGIANKNNDINILGELVVDITGGTAGAFAGVNEGVIKNISLGDKVLIIVNAPSAVVGGFAGKNSGTLDFVYSTADLSCTVTENSVLGGLVGENSGSIKRSLRDIDVALEGSGSSMSSVGGLIGNMTGGSVEKCFTDCAVSGGAEAGGLIGKASGGSVTDCYASDKVGEQAGMLLGTNDGAAVVNGYSASELPESFEGYDFEKVWQKVYAEGAKYRYPSLILTADDGSVVLNFDLRWYTKNTAADEFTIADEEDLAGFAMILNGRFEEFADVDFAGKKVMVTAPINLVFGSWEPIRNFKGTFDGAKNLINGLRVTATDTEPAPDNAGLFDTVLSPAQINDIYIEACAIDGNVNAGAVAGINGGTLLNPVVSLKEAVNAPTAGAVAGNNDGTVTNPISYIEGTLQGGKNAGGISGNNTNDITTPTVTVNGKICSTENAGGISGKNTGSIIKPTVNVNAEGSMICDMLAGGIAADNKGGISEPTVIFSGNIKAADAGMIVGISTTDLVSCRVSGSGTLYGTDHAGGIVSKMSGISVSDGIVEGITIKGDAEVGGVTGEITGGLIETDEVKDVTLEAGDSTVCIGGIAGKVAISEDSDKLWNSRAGVYQGIYKSKVTELSVTSVGAEKAGTNNAAIGGIAGKVEVGSVYDCESEGEIIASGYKDLAAGGAIGSAESAYAVGNTVSVGITAHYAQTYSIGGFIGKLLDSTVRFNKAVSEKPIDIAYEDPSIPVKGMYAGGFAGQADSTESWIISDNMADQNVRAVCLFTNSGNVGVGGFAGQIGGSEAETKVSKCYALGDVYGDGKAYSYAGGFVGEFYKGTIELSFANGNTVTAISPTGAYSGGFAGRLMNASTYINDCYAVDGTVFARAEGANAYADAFYGNKIGNVTNVYGSAKSVIQAPMGSQVVKDNEFILPEQNNPLNAGVELDGFDFAGMTWLYIDGVNEGRPVPGVFESNAFIPDLDILRSQDLSAFVVSNADEFAAMVRYMNDRTIAKLVTDGRTQVDSTDIMLTDDIDISGIFCIPVNELMEGETLDGGNHTVSGITLDNVNAESYGIVSKNSGTIKDIKINGASVKAGNNAALVAGTNSGVIENITVSSDSYVTSSGIAGAVTGTNYGSVTGIETSAVVKGGTAGGVAGLNNGEISGADTKAKVSAVALDENQNSGGITGVNNGTLTDISSSADVSGYYAGGIVGTNGGITAGTIKAASSAANVNGEYAAGGIAGYNYKGTIGADDYGNVRSNAAVKSENGYAGGIAGINSGVGTIAYSDALQGGKIEGSHTAGIAGSGNYDEVTCRYEQCPAPTVDTKERSFTNKITVRLMTEVDNTSIYYTLDGKDPNENSTLYDPDHPITLTVSTTIKAIAIKDNRFVSDVATFVFKRVIASGGGGGGGGGGISVGVQPYTGTTVLTGGEAEKQFTAEQKQALGNMDVEIPVSVVLNSVSGGDDVSVKVPFDSGNGKNPDAIAVYSISDEGVLKLVAHTYENGEISFVTNYSSEFVITWCPIKLYGDLDENAWYHDGIHYAIEHNIMQGVGGGSFMPDANVSRAMVAQVLYNIENRPECNNKISYLDVAEDAWYYDAICWATSEGIMSGYGNGKCGPDDDLSREQLVAVMYRYAKLKGEGFKGAWMFNLEYSDKADVAAWADEAMHWMVMNGIIYGSDGKLMPQGNASRAMIAAVVMRFETFIQK